MNHETGCDEVEDLAAELALGIAAGEERDGANRHLDSCASCRSLVCDLASAGDHLLLVAPSREPPPGFEARVLSRVLAGSTRRSRWRAGLLAAAASVLVAVVSSGSVLHATSGDRRLAASYRTILDRAGGSFFDVATLRGADGTVGSVFGYEGDPSWIFVTLEGRAEPARRLEAWLVTRDGRRRDLGGAMLGGSHASWGRAIPVRLAVVASVEFVDGGGSPVFAGSFAGGAPWPGS